MWFPETASSTKGNSTLSKEMVSEITVRNNIYLQQTRVHSAEYIYLYSNKGKYIEQHSLSDFHKQTKILYTTTVKFITETIRN